MKNTLSISMAAFVLTAVFVGIASADNAVPTIVCSSVADIGNFSGVLGCPGVSSTPDLSPQVQLSLTPTALDATASVPGILASTSVSEHVPIDSPIPLPIEACSLLVKKIVQGGSALASDFLIHVLHNGSDITHSPQPGSGGGTMYAQIAAGAYAITETGGPSGYTPVFSGGCDQDGVVHLSLDENAVCTITNVFATSTATSTPSGGGTSTSTPPSGGGGSSGGSSGGGGGSSSGSSGGSGGGGSAGGGGGPVASAGGSSVVAVNELSGIPALAPSPETQQEEAATPGIPNTGMNGADAWSVLALCAAISIAGSRLLAKSKAY